MTVHVREEDDNAGKQQEGTQQQPADYGLPEHVAEVTLPYPRLEGRCAMPSLRGWAIRVA